MKQVYAEQALVRVWRNIKVLGKVPTSHFGHASVTVQGLGVKTTDYDQPHTQQISFWPGNGGAGLHNAFTDLNGTFSDSPATDRVAEMNKLTAIRLEIGYCTTNGISYPPEWDQALKEANKSSLAETRPGQKRLADSKTSQAWTNDEVQYQLKNGMKFLVPLYSQSPQAKVYLPGLRERNRHWGLNITRMADWWIQFQKDNPPYRAFSPENNCVGIVFRALREGGADAIVPVPKVRAYGEPVQVEEYARALESQLMRLEGSAAFLSKGIQSDHLAQKAVPGNEIQDGIWTAPAWKQASALGALYQRSSLIQEIDRDLDAFQRLTWKYAFEERYALFVRLFLNVVKHRQEKSDSKRAEALAQLGSQILDVAGGSRFYDGYKPAG